MKDTWYRAAFGMHLNCNSKGTAASDGINQLKSHRLQSNKMLKLSCHLPGFIKLTLKISSKSSVRNIAKLSWKGAKSSYLGIWLTVKYVLFFSPWPTTDAKYIQGHLVLCKPSSSTYCQTGLWSVINTLLLSRQSWNPLLPKSFSSWRNGLKLSPMISKMKNPWKSWRRSLTGSHNVMR